MIAFVVFQSFVFIVLAYLLTPMIAFKICCFFYVIQTLAMFAEVFNGGIGGAFWGWLSTTTWFGILIWWIFKKEELGEDE